MAGGLPQQKPSTGGSMAKITKSIFGYGMIYEIPRYSAEEARLDKELRQPKDTGAEKYITPEKITYFLPIIKK
jgi:hypothetical protein